MRMLFLREGRVIATESRRDKHMDVLSIPYSREDNIVKLIAHDH